jgi:succinyl-CoA synthetase beta subunit
MGSVLRNRALAVNPSLPMRRLKLHEYQAGALLHSYKITIPLGNVARTPEEAFNVSNQFKSSGYVVKA